MTTRTGDRAPRPVSPVRTGAPRPGRHKPPRTKTPPNDGRRPEGRLPRPPWESGPATYGRLRAITIRWTWLLYAGVPENDVADWMGHGSTNVLREHYHYIFEGAEQRGRAAIATMLTPGADDPTETSDVA